MNRLIPILIASLAFCSCASQKNTKVYAYRQAVFGGASPRGIIDEKGNEKQQPREMANFFIYLESPDSLQVKEIWIKQKPYAAKEVIVVSTPVVIPSQLKMNAPDTLVHATRNKVYQLTLGPAVQAPTVSPAEQKKITGNEVVVRCVVNGREQYYTAASIKNLPPVALQ
jgi:hypothetical protein